MLKERHRQGTCSRESRKKIEYPYNKLFKSRITVNSNTLSNGHLEQVKLKYHINICGLSEILNVESCSPWPPSSTQLQKCFQVLSNLALWLHSALVSSKSFCLANLKFEQNLKRKCLTCYRI